MRRVNIKQTNFILFNGGILKMAKTEEKKDFQQSINTASIVGALEEINLKFEDKVTDKNTGKIDERGSRISKAEFKNPAFTIKVNDNVVGVEIIPTYQYTKKDGELVENPKFKALQTIMNYEKGTRVKVDGNFSDSGYVKQDGEWYASTKINMFSMTSTAPDTDMAEARVSGIIKSIKEEMKGDEETGRLLVELYAVDYTGATFPIPIVVEEELRFTDEDGEEGVITANDFTDFYDKADSVIFNLELVSRTVGGGNEKAKAALGRGSKIKRGYTVEEFRFVGGDEPIEEPDEDEPTKNDKYYISTSKFKKMLADREVMIEGKKDAKKNEAGSTASSSTSKKGLGRKTQVTEEEIEDDPFN